MKLNGKSSNGSNHSVREHATPIAIIGLGCLFPRAQGPGALWANIKGKVDAIEDVPPTHWRAEDYFDADPRAPDRVYSHRGAFLSPVDFNPLEFGISPHTLEATDSTQLLGLIVAREALRDAGYLGSRVFDRSRTSVILGVTGTLELVIPLGARLGHPLWRRALRDAGVSQATADDVVERMAASYVPWQENSFPGLLGNVAAGRIASRLDLGGTNCVVDAACASSLSAIHLAAMELAQGRSDLAISGGLDTFNDIFMYMCFSKTPALSPSGHARPFDAASDGTTLGEGLGVFVLKRLEDARRDGDRVYAVLRGVGSSSDGKGNAIYAPSAAGQAKALRTAYEVANVNPATIELVEAHGTGTKVGDITEATALSEVYRAARPDSTWCALGSIKSQIGHTKAAAGAAGLMKAVLALHAKVLPPTVKVTQPVEPLQPGKGPFYVNTEARPWLSRVGHPRRAAVSAFGFGGSNFHCVVEESTPEKTTPDWDGDVQIIAWSATSSDALASEIASWPFGAAGESLHVFRAEAARSRARHDPAKQCRLVVAVKHDKANWTRLAETLPALVRSRGHEKMWSTPDGAYYSSAPSQMRGKLAFLFPGQGAQYPGMLRDVACLFPEALNTLDEVDRAHAGGDEVPQGERLSDYIYPPTAFGEDARAANDAALRDTSIAQPALGAAALAAQRILARFNVSADITAGHSFGEIAALAAAGWIEPAALLRLACLRGRLMAAGNGDRGAMAAVALPLDELGRLVRELAPNLVIANRNAPEQGVVSGPSPDVDAFCRALEARDIRSRRLVVSGAFHSPLVAQATRPLADALRSVVFTPTTTPVYSNTTARPYPADPEAARALLAGHLSSPVDFAGEVKSLYQAGARVFLEVGPSNKLSGLVNANLQGQEHIVISFDGSSGKGSGVLDLARALAQLTALGFPVALGRWDDTYNPSTAPGAAKPGVTVRLTGANYVKPREPKPPVAPATPSPAAVKPSDAAPVTAPAPVVSPHLEEAIVALLRIQEQTAELHRKFLEGQEAAMRAIGAMAEPARELAPMPVPRVEPLPVTVDSTLNVESHVTPSPPPSIPTPTIAPPIAPTTAALVSPAVTTALLAVVAEKTGYPVEMLELTMSLDSDLGIDSIKRVEIFSALRERLTEAPEVTPADLPGLGTLEAIARFLSRGSTPPSAMAVQPPAAPESTAAATRSSPVVAPIEAISTQVSQALLAVVAEKTGYPAEMLELDMSLDADLGIDSIKRVEIFSALRERLPAAPEVTPADLPRLATLRAMALFLSSGSNAAQARPEPANEAALRVTPVPVPVSPALEPHPDEPAPRLERLTLGLSSLGVGNRPRLNPRRGGEVWISSLDPLARHVASLLRAHGYAALAAEPRELLARPVPAQLVGLVLWGPFVAGVGAGDALFDCLRLVQHLGPALRQCAVGSPVFLAGVIRFDGQFGLNQFPITADPVHGALAGLVKTVAREWPEIAAKTIDLSVTHDDTLAAAEALVTELLTAGPLEVGVSPDRTLTIQTLPNELTVALPRRAPCGVGDTLVVTGGARGITAEAAVELAKAWRVNLLLLGRSPVPDPEPDWLARLETETDIRRALLERSSGRTTPRENAAACKQVLQAREIRATLSRIEQAGSRALYRSVDARNLSSLKSALAEARSTLGPIRGVVHGAGVLADRRIEDKTRAEFDDVFSTKVDGLRCLLQAMQGDELRVLALFSSSTGRFGRAGQVDYAIANEALNKIAQAEQARRPGSRVVSFNWGPWEGGMVTPALRKIFAAEGVGLIPLADGARQMVRELETVGCKDVEVVVLGPGSSVPAGNEPAAPSPGPSAAVSSASPLTTPAPTRTALRFDLSVDAFPVLASHVLNGKAVLPAAFMLDWLAQGALHEHPGMVFAGLDDLKVFKGVLLGPEDAVALSIRVGLALPGDEDDESLRMPVELWTGEPPTGRLHARATVMLSSHCPSAPRFIAEPTLRPYSPRGPIYDGARLFHGHDLHALEQIEGVSDEGIAARARTSPPPAAWIRKPLRATWITDPLAIDAAFQLLILWSHERHGKACLPAAVGAYRQFERTFPRDGVRVLARLARSSSQAAEAEINFLALDGRPIARLERVEVVIDASLEAAFARNQLAP